jgi:SMODS and SLOG-associating 2TM effector domain 1
LSFAALGWDAAPSVPNVAGLVTVLAAVISAWSQLGRNDERSKSYCLAAHELIMINRRLIMSCYGGTWSVDQGPREGTARMEGVTTKQHRPFYVMRRVTTRPLTRKGAKSVPLAEAAEWRLGTFCAMMADSASRADLLLD